MFARLQPPLPALPRWTGTTLRYRFGKVADGRFHGISYYAVDGEMQAALLGVLPAALRPRFACSYLVVDHHDIPPHVDNGIRVTINAYVLTAGATTTFYGPRDAQVVLERLDNNDPASAAGLYRREDLEVLGGFQAQPQDWWLLDVTQPHDVVGPPGCGPREAYCLQSRSVGFDEVIAAARAG